ncbi:MAG: tRNA1(Val) (adenine(37)-N6)-methyltransferase [Eubacteriales bacterium]|nr:tRNA1(Val) (adenine(37)-N6)-methyltransferase [Eubacteriales bacterium]
MEKEKNGLLRAGERLDDLQFRGLRLIQDPDAFCFGTDSVLLAHFVSLRRNGRAVELCAGSGVVSLLLAARIPAASFELVEIDPDAADRARRSIELNGLSDRVTVTTADLRTFARPGRRIDVVFVNPPYCKAAADGQATDAARCERSCTLDDVSAAAARLLTNRGKLFLIYRADRAADLFCSLRAHGLEPKRICCVSARNGEAPKRILTEAVRGGASGLKWESPLILYERDGRPTRRLCELYAGAGF